jgi:hypothetical protein
MYSKKFTVDSTFNLEREMCYFYNGNCIRIAAVILCVTVGLIIKVIT